MRSPSLQSSQRAGCGRTRRSELARSASIIRLSPLSYTWRATQHVEHSCLRAIALASSSQQGWSLRFASSAARHARARRVPCTRTPSARARVSRCCEPQCVPRMLSATCTPVEPACEISASSHAWAAMCMCTRATSSFARPTGRALPAAARTPLAGARRLCLHGGVAIL